MQKKNPFAELLKWIKRITLTPVRFNHILNNMAQENPWTTYNQLNFKYFLFGFQL